jgi:hypothetical protein
MGGSQTVVVQSEQIDEQKYRHRQYTIRGFARASKSGNALNLLITEADGLHLISLSKADIIDAFNHGSQCCAIEYNLTEDERKELKSHGN